MNPEGLVGCSRSFRGADSDDDGLGDLGKVFAGLGEAVEVVLALSARLDDSSVPEQGKMVAHGRLTLVQLAAEAADVSLPFRKHEEDLEPGRIADLLEKNRSPSNLLEILLGGALGLGCFRGRLRGGFRFRRCGHRGLTRRFGPVGVNEAPPLFNVRVIGMKDRRG